MSGEGVITDLRVAETLRVEVPSPDGGTAVVTIMLEAKSGQVARLRVHAPPEVRVRRPVRKQAVSA